MEWFFYLYTGYGQIKVIRPDEESDSYETKGKLLFYDMPWNENLKGYGKYNTNPKWFDGVSVDDAKKRGTYPDLDPVYDFPKRVPDKFPHPKWFPRSDSIPNPFLPKHSKNYNPDDHPGSAGQYTPNYEF